MPYQIETGSFCASWFGTYDVPGSKPGQTWTVELGGTSFLRCNCPAFKYSKKPEYDRECKHTKMVYANNCGWNIQWAEGNPDFTMKPRDYNYSAIIPNEECPVCGGPVMAVRIAV